MKNKYKSKQNNFYTNKNNNKKSDVQTARSAVKELVRLTTIRAIGSDCRKQSNGCGKENKK